MPDMKSTSASVYGSRPSPGGVAWRPRAVAPAHAAVATAKSRYTTFVAGDRMRFPSVRDILSFVVVRKLGTTTEDAATSAQRYGGRGGISQQSQGCLEKAFINSSSPTPSVARAM